MKALRSSSSPFCRWPGCCRRPFFPAAVLALGCRVHGAEGQGQGGGGDQACVLGKDGVEKIISVDLNAEEQGMFDVSVNAVKGLVDDLKRLGFLK